MTELKIDLDDIRQLAQHALKFASELTFARHGVKCTGLYYNGYKYMSATAVGGDHIGSEYEVEEQLINTAILQHLIDTRLQNRYDYNQPSESDINAIERNVAAYLFDPSRIE